MPWHILSGGLPRPVSGAFAAYAAANVTTARDLSPISAALAAYAFIITHRTGTGLLKMQDVSADSAKKISPKKGNNRNACSETIALAGCYGQIGISAVAAAARYQGGAKNPAYAPASSQWRDRIAEAAA